jgi:hypothetical protein
MGIPVGGNETEYIDKLKNKGFKAYDKKGNITYLKGEINDEEVTLGAISTPISKTIWKLVIFFPIQNSWGLLKIQYDRYLKSLTDKYGQPLVSNYTFEIPFKDGDGHELSAVKLKKCHFASYWSTQFIQITEICAVSISYENADNVKLNEKERSENDQKIF